MSESDKNVDEINQLVKTQQNKLQKLKNEVIVYNYYSRN